jgi:hypothetical protein
MERKMSNQRVIDVIRAVGRETNAPQEIVEAVVRRVLPSIRLVPQFPGEGEAPQVGGCRIGGLPDLPQGFKWPRLAAALRSDAPGAQSMDQPLWFLMQINLTEVVIADVGNILPRSGMLYFFFHWHSVDEPDAPDAGLVLFHPGDEESLRRTEPPVDLHPAGRFRGFGLSPCLEWTVPPCDGTNYQLGFWDSLNFRVAEVQGLQDGWGPAPAHRMLGYPEALQSWELGEGELLLLQVCSDGPALNSGEGPYQDTGMMWGDAGRIYFIILEKDVKSRDFGSVWAHLEDQ